MTPAGLMNQTPTKREEEENGTFDIGDGNQGGSR